MSNANALDRRREDTPVIRADAIESRVIESVIVRGISLRSAPTNARRTTSNSANRSGSALPRNRSRH